MNILNSVPSGAVTAIIDYGDILEDMDGSKVQRNDSYNTNIIRQIHKHISSFFGEESILRDTDQGTFEMLCEAPFMSVFGQDLYPTIYDKAAKIMESFATHQVFTNGNKRLAVGATIQFLKSQNIKLTLDKQSMCNLVQNIANKRLGDAKKDVLVGDYYLKENIVNIANIFRKNSTVINATLKYSPIGTAKNFNKEEYDNAKNILDHGKQDFGEPYGYYR